MRQVRRRVLRQPRLLPALPIRAVGRRDAARVPAQRGAQVGRHRARGARVRHGRVPARHAVFRIPAQAAGRHRAHRVPGPRGELPVRAQHHHAHARLLARGGALLPRAAGHRRRVVPRVAQPRRDHVRHPRHLPRGARVRRRAVRGVPRHLRHHLREVPAVRRRARPHSHRPAALGLTTWDVLALDQRLRGPRLPAGHGRVTASSS